MQSFFNPDNPFWCFINKIIGLVVLSMVFTLCCLPIVTIGPACAALYYAVVKSIRRERGYCTSEFFRAFRANLKNGILSTLILLALAAMMLVSDIGTIIFYLGAGETANVVSIGMFLIKLSLILGFSLWLYPLMSRFDQKLTSLCGYALLMLIKRPLSSLMYILLLIITIIILFVKPLLLAIIPGVCSLLISLRIEPVLQSMCEESDGSTADPWYLGR